MIDSEGANHDQKKEPRNERRVDVEFERSPTKRLIDPSTGVSNDVATSSGTIPRFFEERSSIHIYIYIYRVFLFSSLPEPPHRYRRLPLLFFVSSLQRRVGLLLRCIVRQLITCG